MNNKSIVPRIGEEGDFAFCQEKESYLQFVREWKAIYRQLSNEIRCLKLTRRAADSELANPGNKHSNRLQRMAKSVKISPVPDWVASYLNGPFYLAIEGRSALATDLIQLRRDAKVAANAAWHRAHLQPS